MDQLLEVVTSVNSVLNDFAWGPVMLLLLVGTGVLLTVRTGCVLALIVPGPGCICGFLGHEKEYVIPFGSVCQIGEDIILVDVKRKDVEAACRD